MTLLHLVHAVCTTHQNLSKTFFYFILIFHAHGSFDENVAGYQTNLEKNHFSIFTSGLFFKCSRGGFNLHLPFKKNCIAAMR